MSPTVALVATMTHATQAFRSSPALRATLISDFQGNLATTFCIGASSTSTWTSSNSMNRSAIRSSLEGRRHLRYGSPRSARRRNTAARTRGMRRVDARLLIVVVVALEMPCDYGATKRARDGEQPACIQYPARRGAQAARCIERRHWRWHSNIGRSASDFERRAPG